MKQFVPSGSNPNVPSSKHASKNCKLFHNVLVLKMFSQEEKEDNPVLKP